MKKEWYIFINSSHIGPYSLIEMKAFYDTRDIRDNTLVWKEGMKEWQPVKKVDLFSPFLPDVPPPLPPDILKKTTSPVEGISIPSILKDHSPEAKPEVKTKSTFSIKIAASISVLMILISALVVYKNSAEPDLHIKGISPYNRELLEQQLRIDEKNMSFALALSMDKNNLWVATNQKNNLSVTIDLTADPKRVLGDENREKVIVRLQGVVVNHLGHFTTMKMIKGKTFFPGEYIVHIKGKKIHWLNQYFKLNKHDLNREFTVDFKSLIYSGNSREFERKLEERKLEKINKLIKPLQDKLEGLQTLKSLTEKNMEIFLANLEKSTSGENFAGFEKSYMTEVGPIVQVIVLAANDEQIKNLEYKRFNEAIIDLGKRIGEVATEMIAKISPLKKISTKTKTKWRSHFQAKTEAIEAMIKIYVAQVEAQIREIQFPSK